MIKRVGLRAWWLVGLLCVACTGGHGTSTLPPTTPTTTDGSTRQIASVAQSANRLISINAGGAAVGTFVADTDFVNGTTSSVRGSNVAIDTSTTNAAPEAVYTTYRESAGSFSYVYKTAFVPGQPAFVRLHFAEVLGLHAGQRQFNVAVNDAPALTNFDIFAAAGDADNKAVVVDVPFTPDASGTVTITFSPGAAGYPIVAGLEIYGVAAAPGTLSPPTDVLINSGGPATGSFSSDSFVNGLSETGTDSSPIDVSGPNTAPAAIYATYRSEPKTVAYLVTGLAPNTAFSGYLHFEEPQFGGAGQRVMSINAGGSSVSARFDIFVAAGDKMHRAVALPLTVTSSASGTIPITLTGLNGAPAIISGFELHETVGPTPAPTPLPTPTAGPPQTLFVSNGGNSTVSVYAPPYTDLPSTIDTSANGQPFALAVGPQQALFVALGHNAVGIYGPPYTASTATFITAQGGLSSPLALGFDAYGDLFAANNYTSTVTEYVPPYTGTPTTITGAFHQPEQMVVDGAGDLFITSYQGGLTEVTPPYFNTSIPITNGINGPTTLLLDPQGDLFVSNSNKTVTEYAPPYTGAPIATIGTGAYNPSGLALDRVGNLFISTYSDVAEFAPPYTGTPIHTVTDGISQGGPLAVDNAGNLYVANLLNSTITVYAPPYSGMPLTFRTGISHPNAIVLAPPTLPLPTPGPTASPSPSHILFVANSNNNTVTALKPPYTGAPIATIGANGGANGPVVDSKGDVFVNTGTLDSTVAEYAPPYTGTPAASIRSGTFPTGALAIDKNDNLFIAADNAVNEFAPPYTGSPTVIKAGGLASPQRMAFDAAGNLFVEDPQSGPAGKIVIYSPPYTGNPMVTITNGIHEPTGMILDGSGDLFVANLLANVTIYAPPYTASPTTVTTGISAPYSLALDSRGDLFVGNSATDNITEYAPPYTGPPMTSISLGPSSRANALSVDSANDVFVAAFYGLAEYFTPPYTGPPTWLVYGSNEPSDLVFGP